MPRLNTYHLPPNQWPDVEGSRTLLTGPEARHLLGVLRAKPGDSLRLFDGQGRSGLFKIVGVSGKDKAELVVESLFLEPMPTSGLVLALGWNKSSRRDWVLEKAVELDALGLLFWQAVRSQGAPPAVAKDSWQEKCVQAAKQCGSVWLPELGIAHGGVEGLIRVAADPGGCYAGCYVLDENAATDALPDPASLASGKNLVVIGPEGGLERREAEALAQSDFKPLSLGPRPLRWETAALYCLGLAHFAARTSQHSRSSCA
ncbi:MAG: RsmE family RNA methyltransferase [Humidesulfovibrio sp.]|uniref:RsmE family RNA methyltransferase n=1 Tax=Humidesulfovibrio sp. TaxID=2910988 RepID=UPI0027FC6036|nr:RsmE family RNA methyltransferase [Humidesulfovibrio sp.]MDQ7834453.1 RsmE family RNA methyltransferase [Humidesulfovibrio sp.]